MGYRSDVHIVMLEEDYHRYLGEMLLASIILVEDYNQTSIYKNHKFIEFGYNSVKWYSPCVDVTIVEEFLQKLEKEDRPFSFVRLGEEIDDIEKRENIIYQQLSIDVFFDVEDAVNELKNLNERAK